MRRHWNDACIKSSTPERRARSRRRSCNSLTYVGCGVLEMVLTELASGLVGHLLVRLLRVQEGGELVSGVLSYGVLVQCIDDVGAERVGELARGAVFHS